jgi:hypothetical protein
VHTAEVSNAPCHDLAQTFGYAESDFRVSRYAIELAADGGSVHGRSHSPFDGPQSCYRELPAGVPAFGNVDRSKRTLRYWVTTKAKDLRVVTGSGVERVLLPERMAQEIEPATNAAHWGLSFAVSFPLETPASTAFIPMGVNIGENRTLGIEGRFDVCQTSRSDLFLQERDLRVDFTSAAFDPEGRRTCCYGDGCMTAVP